jgi:hypothetical protein
MAVIMAVVMAVPSYAETIWGKRQKVMQGQGGAEETKAEALESAVQEEESIPGAYNEEAEMEPAYEDEEEYADIHKTTSETTDPYEIYVPEEYGTIIESYKGTNGKLIMHIQDPHVNYEGQMNIAKILESLIEDYNLNTVLLEGKVTDRDFSYVRDRAPLEERIKKADKLLKETYINGVDYISIATDLDMKIQGIEDKKLYDINTEAMQEMDQLKGAGTEYMSKMAVTCDAVKSKV